MNDKNLKLGFVQGFLEAFGTINLYANHGTIFSFETIPFIDTAQNSLDIYFKTTETGYSPSLGEQVADIKDLSHSIEEWFFDDKAGDGKRYPNVDKFTREASTEALVAALKSFFEEKEYQIHRLNIKEEDKLYELVWDNYLFQSGLELYLLHFGMTD